MANGVVLHRGLYGVDFKPAIWSFLYITIYHKITAVFTAVLFLLSVVGPELAEAARTDISSMRIGIEKPAGSLQRKELDVESFQIPDKLGSLKDKHIGTGGTIIFIQDAHCNYPAQQSISNIIRHLNEEYGVTLINLEGGRGDYDLSLFSDIEDANIRDRVSEYFMKEGRVSGPEYFAINNPEKVDLFGIEDADLYIKNVDVYKDSLEYISGVNNTLDYIASRTKELKSHIYSTTLLELDKRYEDFRENKTDLKEFIDHIFNLSLKKRLSLKGFPNIRAIYEAISKEKSVDFKKANSERDKLIDELKEKLSLNAMDKLTLKTFLFKTGQLSQSAFYNYLTELAEKYKIGLESKQNLSNYITYISIYEGADKVEVFNEIDALYELIAEKELKGDTGRRLFKISKNVRILKSIFNIRATRREIDYFNKNKSDFNINTLRI